MRNDLDLRVADCVTRLDKERTLGTNAGRLGEGLANSPHPDFKFFRAFLPKLPVVGNSIGLIRRLICPNLLKCSSRENRASKRVKPRNQQQSQRGG